MPKINTTLYGDLALIPQVAEVPVIETLSFLTDQIESYDGTEQNIQLRSKPRQSFNFQIPLQGGVDAGVFNTAYGGIRQKWAVPQWTDAQYVGSVADAATSVTCDTTNYDLRADSLAMLFNGCGGYRILEITTLDEDQINFAALDGAIKGAMLIPVRVGFVTGNINKSTNGYNGKAKISFFVDDTLEYVPDAPEQYLANDIYYTPTLLDGDSVETEIQQRQDVIDYELGVVERRSPWLHAKFGRRYRSLTATPAERKEFRDFIYRRQGKSRPFWMPTFENNLRLKNTGTIVSTLVTPLDSYSDYATGRTHIAVEAAGVWYPRVISAPTPTGPDTMQFTLSSALNIPANSVSRVSYLGLNRLNTDIIELNYNNSTTVETAFQILELSP